MAIAISPLQITNAQQWSGLTTENNIGYMGGLERIKFNIMDSIMEINFGPEFDKFVQQFPLREIDDDREFEWFLCGPNIKNYPLINWYDASGNQVAQPGLNFSRFFMVFPVRMFEITDTIGTDSKETYQLQVKAEPKQVQGGWEYEVELITGNQALFVPATELVAGTRYAKLFSPTEQTLSQRGGTVQHESYFKMYNRTSMIRTNVDVPGNMISKSLGDGDYAKGFFYKGKDGQLVKNWIDKLSMDLRIQFNRQKSNLHLYAINNKTSQGTYANKGESGYEIKMGAGLFEQISASNIYYNTFWDLDYLKQIMLDLSINKLPQDMRKFKLATGERGWIRFHELVEAAGLQFSTMNAGNRITGSGNELRLGGQYTKFGYLQGIEMELTYMPIFDDPTFNTKLHPDGGLQSSYEILVMDIGTTGGKPNVNRISIKGQEEAWAYVPGLRDPFSPTGSFVAPKMATSGKDGYSVFGAFWGGLQVTNPTKMAWIRMNFI
tara:strand:+ start:357 stop:1835 length:1479 start_codon:yes stop_codon:yes gene_type:complete